MRHALDKSWLCLNTVRLPIDLTIHVLHDYSISAILYTKYCHVHIKIEQLSKHGISTRIQCKLNQCQILVEK